jgi:hypothetical protein
MSEMPKECECCSNTTTITEVDGKRTVENPLKLYMAMWMCPSCIAKNKELQDKSEMESGARVTAEKERSAEVIAVNKILREAKSIDASIQVKTDLFNAETVSIIDIKKAIDEDANIENKNGQLAEMLLSRYQMYKEKIFANNAENVELANKQNAIQKYLNDLKNKLTEVERAKYQLLDVNYQPSKVKIANKPINSPAKPKKYDKAEILKAAQRANVPTSVIQMICVAKNMTPMQASDSLLEAGSKQVNS